MQILRIDSSTTGDQSISRKLTDELLAHFTNLHPEAKVVTRDLVAEPLAHIDPITTSAIRTPPETHEEAVAAAYPAERAVLDEFLASDIVIVGAPMYNFSIASQLKAWLDRLGVPGVTFKYSENGPEGLAGGRKVVVASARGGEYSNDQMAENQESLLTTFFGFVGVEDLHFVRVEKAGYGPEAIEAGLAAAKEEIAKL
ncbi:NAD(P)H-dependent oxidoreductase [Erythrobacter sp.]|uniref:FMN-dependent NADH-azoreductase n=1 Tax=Erythrobacter sp. TaxID=1042 RepID=UPI001AFF2AA6|nr:NAD(P)H-dependent oxidoreductase [Erythrobacter sp.]MBO6528074.1 NAD(P)H-dependent oxidoreductase [Erythrobacter sp.]MBO6528765.1 NAD(P)H-dependent oxidoreductase [Erythrobacter sp.]